MIGEKFESDCPYRALRCWPGSPQALTGLIDVGACCMSFLPNTRRVGWVPTY